MAQIKIYGLKNHITACRTRLSDAIHACVVEALQYPPDKRFHRFFPLEPEDFVYPADRSEQYTIIEISLFEGRSDEAKKQLIRRLFAKLQDEVGLALQDVEITIFESPRQNWGIRGQPGDEIGLSYRVDV